MSEICSRSVVLYGGKMMEDAPVDLLFNNPSHPYSRALLDCVPRLEDRPGDLKPIEGTSYSQAQASDGCPFTSRCPLAYEQCAAAPPPEVIRDGHRVACWRVPA